VFDGYDNNPVISDANANVIITSTDCYCVSGLDECGVCAGSGIADGFCDCEDNILDECGICDGGCFDSDTCTPNISCADCAGVPNGDAYWDNCSLCVGGTTGAEECPLDCNGLPGGPDGIPDNGDEAGFDVCDECAGPGLGTGVYNMDCWDGDEYCSIYDCPIGGFQFELLGIAIETHPHAHQTHVSISSTTVLRFSLDGSTIPPGIGTLLTTVSFTVNDDYAENGLCFGEDTGSSGDTAISDRYGKYILADWGNCICPDNNPADDCGVCGGDGYAEGTCDCEGNTDKGCGCGEEGPAPDCWDNETEVCYLYECPPNLQRHSLDKH
jgi:hypothetical protein